jgi:hypothetical protein
VPEALLEHDLAARILEPQEGNGTLVVDAAARSITCLTLSLPVAGRMRA